MIQSEWACGTHTLSQEKTHRTLIRSGATTLLKMDVFAIAHKNAFAKTVPTMRVNTIVSKNTTTAQQRRETYSAIDY